MLKTSLLCFPQQNSSNITCGEIVCQAETSFFIVCKVCGIKIFDYGEFIGHFRALHWCDFVASYDNAEDDLKKNCEIEKQELSDKKIQEREEDLDNLFGEFQLYINEDEEYNQNESILRKVGKTKDKQFECSHCGSKFSTKLKLSAHERKLHSSNAHQQEKTNKSHVEKPYLKLQHSFHEQYSCRQCEKTFEKYEALRYHLENHIETRNYICDYQNCGKGFANKRRLSAHKRNHFTQPSYMCEICGSLQRSKEFLTVHLRTHTGEKPYACTLCDRRFASKHFLKDHKAVHATERPHVCDVCGKAFAGRKSLYHHSYLHLGVKNFVCKICKRAYSQASGLSAHMRKHKIDSGLLAKNTSLSNCN